MTTKKKPQTKRKGKADSELSPVAIENLAGMIAAVLDHPATPKELSRAMRYALDEVHNDLADANRITDSAEYITLLLIEHAAGEKGGE